MSKRRIKKVFKQVRDANLRYHLLEDRDRVAVGVSGGKDSLVMLYFLLLMKKYTPLDFELLPVYLDLGWNNDVDLLAAFCEASGIPFHHENTNIGEIVFAVRQEKSPCSLCSNLRRGALNRTAKALGCNKVALGHHLDDVVTTLLMSILYEGRYNVFKPLTYLDRMDITVVRPMIYVEEDDIKAIALDLALPFVKNNCPADGFTRRDDVAEILSYLQNFHPGAKRRLLSSIEHVNQESFWN